MAQRGRELHPDQVFTTRAGEQIPIVSEEQFLQELVELGRFQMFAGGVITSVVFRHPTGAPNEMVTVGALLEWKDRTDAKPQPEPQSPIPQLQESEMFIGQVPPEDSVVLAAKIEAGQPVSREEIEAALAAPEPEPYVEPGPPQSAPPGEPAPPASDEDLDDGLGDDPDAVDDSAIPEHAR